MTLVYFLFFNFRKMRCLTFILNVAAYAVIFLSMAQFIHAQTNNLVTDGGFTNLITNTPTITTNTPYSGYTTNGGQLGYNVYAVGWSNTPATNVNGTGSASIGYNFLFTTNMVSNNASVTGNGGALALYNQLSVPRHDFNDFTNPPEGGNFIAADGAYQTAAITQSITNLVVGTTYILTFYYGAAQQTTYTTETTENWQVTMGSTTFTTPTLTNRAASFTGWDLYSNSFTATNTTEVLSFLASGTPSGEPPFSLLANVSIIAAVPEASSVIAAGLLLLILCAAPLLKSFKEKKRETLCSTEGAGSGYP